MSAKKQIEIKESESEKLELAKIEKLQSDAERLKKTYSLKKVFYISTEDEDSGEEIGAFFRKPSLKEFSQFSSISQKDSIAGIQNLMNNVFLEGNKLVIEDDDYFLACMQQIESIVQVQASTVKKF